MFNFSAQFQAMKTSLISLVLILATAIIGLGWLGIALYAVFVHYIGPIWGPLALGGLFLLPLIIYALMHALPGNQKKRKQSAFEQAFANSTVGSMSILIETLQGTSPILATLAAVAAGFIATRFPQFLPILAQLISAVAQEVDLRKAKYAEHKARKAREAAENVTAPPPPDVEPVARRRKKTADMY